MKLVQIPKDKYNEYRLNVMFDCYKWDPQFLDHNTVAKYALVISEEEHKELTRLTEELDQETRAAEEFLNKNLELAKPLKLSRKMKKEIKSMSYYKTDKHIRLMRYDFHPTTTGQWAISEVNSDVPGGFAEASVMPKAVLEFLDNDKYKIKSFADTMVEAVSKKVPENGCIMMVHCTCYSDDRQVMQFLGDKLKAKGYKVLYGAADHLHFKNKKAYSILDGNEGEVDAIFRFTPLEWLPEIKPKKWDGYFDTDTVSCNHPIAIFAQTKRFPFVWDVLEKNGIDMSTWRKLLPETIEVKDVKKRESFIFKPVYGRVGENISIKDACEPEEYKKIMRQVKRHPEKYLAQKQFDSKPLVGEMGEEYHVCLGSYSIEGKHGGYYARISDTRRIDSNAADIPVLIEVENNRIKTSDVKDENINIKNNELKEIYKAWAPVGKKWVDWVRPVPFLTIKEIAKNANYHKVSANISILFEEQFKESMEIYNNAAIVVDLPDVQSVGAGIALTRFGYRPIPVFNGTMPQANSKSVVDNESIGRALIWGAIELKKVDIRDDARPAFLLDSERLNRRRKNSNIFDNSWDIYHQDLPSANYFLANGIKKIIVIGNDFSKDLNKIFYGFVNKGMEIYLTDGYESPRKIKVKKPGIHDRD